MSNLLSLGTARCPDHPLSSWDQAPWQVLMANGSCALGGCNSSSVWWMCCEHRYQNRPLSNIGRQILPHFIFKTLGTAWGKWEQEVYHISQANTSQLLRGEQPAIWAWKPLKAQLKGHFVSSKTILRCPLPPCSFLPHHPKNFSK